MAPSPHLKPVSKAILLVDDDPAHLAVCERVLRRAGHHVLTATNGASALRTLAITSVDLLIVDVFMPERDGFETIATVRRKNPGIRIIAMSGGGVVSGPGDVLEQCRKLGAMATLTKPFSDEDLLRVVDEVIGRK